VEFSERLFAGVSFSDKCNQMNFANFANPK